MLAEGCDLSMGKFRHHRGLDKGHGLKADVYHGNCVPWTLGNNCPGPGDIIVF